MEPSIWGVHDHDPATGQASGCGWYRIILPLRGLAEHGWKTGAAAGQPPPDADPYRLLIAQRLDKPGVLPAWRRLRLRHRLVYEIDDDVWSISKSNWAAYCTYNQGSVLDTMVHAAQIADMITVTTGPLAEVIAARTGHRNIKILPNAVPDEVLTLSRSRSPRSTVTIGWAGGSSHAMDTAMVAVPVHEFLERHHPAAELHIIGTDFRRTFGWPHARYTPWIPSDESLAYYRAIDFDIALCPLTGTEFDQSKSAIKAVEAMALGIPVLASDVAPYREVIDDGVNGYLIRKRGDWGRRLRELTCDSQAREEMGARAREAARAHTITARWEQWADALGELL